MLFYTIVLLTTAVDRLSKLWVRANMQVGETKAVWEPYVSFLHFENTGAAGSSFQGFGRYFIVVGVLFVAGALYFRRKGHLQGWLLQSGAAFLVGGAIGNTWDRIVYGKVTDFLVFGSRGGIMNMADLFLNVGVLLILADLARNWWRSRGDKEAPDPPPSADGFRA